MHEWRFFQLGACPPAPLSIAPSEKLHAIPGFMEKRYDYSDKESQAVRFTRGCLYHSRSMVNPCVEEEGT